MQEKKLKKSIFKRIFRIKTLSERYMDKSIRKNL